MRIQGLITKLEKLKEKHGNLKVTFSEAYSTGFVDSDPSLWINDKKLKLISKLDISETYDHDCEIIEERV